MSIYSAWMRKNPKFAAIWQKIGGYCSICSRNSCRGLDLCVHCEGLLLRLCHTDNSGHTTRVCIGCGSWIPLFKQPANADFPNSVDSEQAPNPSAVAHKLCNACQKTPPLLSRVVAPYRYAFPLDRMIQNMKYREQRSTARVLGILLSREVARQINTADLPDMLIPVPMHRRRELKRGFNQAADIARWCARELELPHSSRWASRLADTDSLAGLSRTERQHRILGAFRASPAVSGQRVAIVDDVLTTGSTARELARELYDTGARSVELWALARTSSDRLPG